MSASGSGVVHRARGADELLLAVEPEPVLGEGRQVGIVDPASEETVVVLLKDDLGQVLSIVRRDVKDRSGASEVVSHMPCVNELVGGIAIWQEPSRFPLLTAESKLLKLYEKDKFSFRFVLRLPFGQ